MLLPAFPKYDTETDLESDLGESFPALGDQLSDGKSFPVLSETVVEVLELTSSEDASINDLSHLIKRDAILAAAILKKANSCLYGGKKLADIQQAINRLGFRDSANLVIAVGMKYMMADFPQETLSTCDLLLRHSLFTAILASSLNKKLQLGYHGEEFTAALMHDVGRIIICSRAGKEFIQIDPMTFYESQENLRRERHYLQTDHCVIGSRFAESNSLPAVIGDCILFHHQPIEEHPHATLIHLVSLADEITNYIQRYHNLQGFSLDDCHCAEIIQRSWGKERLEIFRTTLRPLVLATIRETRQILKSANLGQRPCEQHCSCWIHDRQRNLQEQTS